jgi:hypothetical protein
MAVAQAALACSGSPRVNPGATGGSASGGSSSATGGTSGIGGATGGLSGTGGAVTGGTAAATGGTSSPATGGTQASSGGSSAGNCPDSSAYVGDSTWQFQLQATASADYCGGSNENRTIEQELAAKAKLHITAGTYPLPDKTGTYSFALPVCFEFPSGTEAPKFAGAGQVAATQSTFAPNVYYTDRISQPLTSSTSNSLTFHATIDSAVPTGTKRPPFVLDGSAYDYDSSGGYSIQLCDGTTCSGKWSDVGFLSCNPTSYRLSETKVTFSGGTVTLDLRIGQSMASTEPAMFVAASGTLDGSSFAQSNYWKLIYRPEHHHFVRHFAVLFDTAISGSCGLKIDGVDPYNGTQLPQVYTINCDLSNIAARTVSAAVTQTP